MLQHLKPDFQSFACIVRVAYLVKLLFFNITTSFLSYVSKKDKNFIKRIKKYDEDSNRLLFTWGEKFIVFYDSFSPWAKISSKWKFSR